MINEFFYLLYPQTHIRDFQQLPIPFSCVATNLISGEEKIFDSGSLHESIRASMSFPSIFKPFEVEGKFYIDGGINQNLPTSVVQDMGAEFVIGSCTSSTLRNSEEIVTMINVLEQSMGFQINRNVYESANQTDLLIEPELADVTYLDFDKAEDLIAAGESAARNYLDRLRLLPRRENNQQPKEILNPKLRFSKLSVEGNTYLSSSKIIEYLRLKKGELYSIDDLKKAFSIAYNMNLFEYLYPVIEEYGTGKYGLTIKVKEKNRKKLGIDFSYNEENEFGAGITLILDNYLQRNSKLIANAQVGENTQLNLDYVKNFGRLFGVYFRLFPNYQEKIIYSYNEDHEKMNSVKSSEYGATFGLGMFVNRLFNIEAYGYTAQTKMYRNIADFETTHYRTSGIGAKFNVETLDNYLFPMKGIELFAKISGAKAEFYSDEGYTKFYAKMRVLFPIRKHLSMKYGFEYGSYFDNDNIDIDPFYIGGIDSFPGLKKQEMGAPIFKTHILAGRIKLTRDFYVDLQYNRMNLGNSDVWLPEKNFYQAAGIKLGLDNILIPIRTALFINQDNDLNFYLSIGYEFDSFEFSRR